MSFLQLIDDSENSILNAKQIVDWKKNNNSYNFTNLPKTVILINSINYISRINKLFTKKIKGLSATIYKLNTDFLLCTKFGNGSPSVIAIMEELQQLGVEKFIFIGFAGRITENLKEGTVNIINKAFSLVGTSYHYYNEQEINITNKLIDKYIKLFNLKTNTILSTDAPYRELPSQLLYFSDKGVALIDMEIASILAFSKSKKIDCVCFSIAADSLTDNTWQAPNINFNKIINKIIKTIIA